MGTTTTNKKLVQPTVGGDVGSWGNENNNTIGFLDTILGGTVTKDCTGNVDVQLTNAESQNFIVHLTGVPTANINILIPLPGDYLVVNNATGAFSITVKVTVGGTGVVVPQATGTNVASDGTNFYGETASSTAAAPYWCGTSTGSANQQLLTPVSISLTSLSAGNLFTAVAGFTNTTAMTVGVSGTGGFQPAVRRTSTGPQPFVGGEVVLNNAYLWLWDGGQFQLMD